ncbi:hypothetical protein SPHINGO361_100593 [Sphingomonas sp. EC-HK361]|jgi:hypothetical protein|uniref:hypothetical protein n=1 Tax=Sphingomonas sp. EC-HK361 TaxID=2038397 RepID=UPI001256D30D|nr:hypothetical protein [Sphingomonas sp. EC-HK361]VVT00191.1 hypothetical protein SPHINGO361_100593 [Sphingomonas sp. EC-HK361]
MDEMSDHALGGPLDRIAPPVAPAPAAQERDRVESFVRSLSRLAGYASLAAAVVGIAYLVIR